MIPELPDYLREEVESVALLKLALELADEKGADWIATPVWAGEIGEATAYAAEELTALGVHVDLDAIDEADAVMRDAMWDGNYDLYGAKAISNLRDLART